MQLCSVAADVYWHVSEAIKQILQGLTKSLNSTRPARWSTSKTSSAMTRLVSDHYWDLMLIKCQQAKWKGKTHSRQLSPAEPPLKTAPNLYCGPYTQMQHYGWHGSSFLKRRFFWASLKEKKSIIYLYILVKRGKLLLFWKLVSLKFWSFSQAYSAESGW